MSAPSLQRLTVMFFAMIWIFSDALAVKASPSLFPLSLSPSQGWDGNDGPWSTFAIRIGSPDQAVRVLPSTAIPESWAVLPQGCPSDGPPSCNDSRGTLFYPNQSTSWQNSGLYDLAIERNLGYTDFNTGEYGLDTLSLGWLGSGGPTLRDQVLAGIATKQWFLGVLGINPKSINLTNFPDPRPSLLLTLKSTDQIPSLSYGYTAGAPYRLKKVLASLTLGGYDASRFTPNDVRFTLAPDNSRDLIVAVQLITMVTANGSTDTLLAEPTYAYIDSTVPHIWLPLQVCQAFESAFGISWDASTDLYLVNDALHDSLLSQNASVTFQLGDSLSGGKSTPITLPYASFDLSVSWPIVKNATRYFPLRRAANDSQVTLGRTFLQEAYLTVDYERGNFSISQTKFNLLEQQRLVAILSPNTTSIGTPGSDPHGHLASGTVAGIVVGIILAIALLALLILRYRKRKRYSEKKETFDQTDATQQYTKHELDTLEQGIAEISGDKIPETTAEMEGRCIAVMAGGSPVYEMPGVEPDRPELPGHEPDRNDCPRQYYRRD